MLRNKELCFQLAAQILISVIACVICVFISLTACIIVAVSSLLIIIAGLVAAKARCNKLSLLCDDIDKILNGDDSISFDSYEEGDISILKTEIGKMTTKIREQNNKLKSDKSILKDSLADISHQLKTPLTSMSIILTMLRTKELSDSDKKRYIRDLSMLISKTEWLIDTLLKLSSFEAKAITMEKKEFSCSELIKSATEPLMIMAELKETELVTVAGDEKLVADFRWCNEALQNIIKNCIEHSNSGSEIVISPEENALAVTITVEGGGNRISEKDFPHIFERYYKTDNVNHQGYGIGLALSKQIINEHGGVIRAENTDKGVKFTIIFYKSTV